MVCRHRGELYRGGWLTSCPGYLYLGNDLDIHCTGDLVGSRAGLDGCGEYLLPPLGLKPRTFRPVTDRYAYYAIPVLEQKCTFEYSEGNRV